MPRMSDTADRIVKEAMRLFGEKGYERTTIADIQKAAGLHPGSGALYKHFPSKEAVLQAGLDKLAAASRQAKTLMAELQGPAPDVMLRLGAAALEMLQEEQDALRIIWRELEAFPQMRDAARDARLQTTYAALAQWLRARSASGELRVEDPEAAAVVVLGSINMFRLFENLLGGRLMGLDDDRFLRAWHSLLTQGMLPPPHPGAAAEVGEPPPRT